VKNIPEEREDWLRKFAEPIDHPIKSQVPFSALTPAV
jgi:hypothetical protein